MNSIISTAAKRVVLQGRRCASNVKPAAADEEPSLPTSKAGDPMKSFYADDVIIERASVFQQKRKPEKSSELKFGHTYSDHMLEANWDKHKGWTVPKISPLRNFSIHPGAKVLHYASELFEGMKAYRGLDGKIRLFRPEMNMERMRRTAKRCALPDFESEELIKLISETIRIDREWVPYSNFCSLYIRPTMIGTDPTLGVGFPEQAKMFVITGPVGQYYSTGFQAITLLADPQYIRAFPGGVGAYKMGCNYAPTIWVSHEAAKLGCQQVLWLHGEDHEITEVGTMNIFLFWKNEQGETELITPPLEKGLILPGITRDSLLTLARSMNEFKVTERFVSMEEIRAAIKSKRMMEMFGAGTACVVSPVGKILYRNGNEYEHLEIPTMQQKYPSLMQRFYDTINDIQYGKVPDHDWVREVC